MKQKQKPLHLILPMQPTPNGRMHIGHVAGPYLRADILARSLRRQGNRVVVASGTDAYENWVVLEAKKENKDPEEICNDNHALIGIDFSNIDIEFDCWINPLSKKHKEEYARLHSDLLSDLIDGDEVSLVSEPVPISSDSGEYIIGAWIAGQCPNCEQDVAGNSCVKCGAGFQPSEIKKPWSRLDRSELKWVKKDSWFTKQKEHKKFIEALKKTGISNELISISKSHLKRSGSRVRVSQPGSWGIKSDLIDSDCVLTNTFYGFSLYCAEVAAKSIGYDTGFLESRIRNVTVTTLFGKDNAGIGLIAPSAISLSSSKYRLFDNIIVNHMLHFEGSKCSTSRKHGIWISELIENTNISSDELRYYLSQAPLESGTASLSLSALVENVNRLRSWYNKKFLDLAFANASYDCDPKVSATALSLIETQSFHIQPSRLYMQSATRVLDSWMFESNVNLDKPTHARSWLQGLALLAFPIMPSLAENVWKTLGFKGIPSTEKIHTQAPVKEWIRNSQVPLLSVEELIPFVHISKDTI